MSPDRLRPRGYRALRYVCFTKKFVSHAQHPKKVYQKYAMFHDTFVHQSGLKRAQGTQKWMRGSPGSSNMKGRNNCAPSLDYCAPCLEGKIFCRKKSQVIVAGWSGRLLGGSGHLDIGRKISTTAPYNRFLAVAVVHPWACQRELIHLDFSPGIGGRTSVLDEEAAARDNKSWPACSRSTCSYLHSESTWLEGSSRSRPRHHWRQAAGRGRAGSSITAQPF